METKAPESGSLDGRVRKAPEVVAYRFLIHTTVPPHYGYSHPGDPDYEHARSIGEPVYLVPEGWRFVPDTPRQDQIDYAAYNINRKTDKDIVTPWLVKQCYDNMLFAAGVCPLLPSNAER